MISWKFRIAALLLALCVLLSGCSFLDLLQEEQEDTGASQTQQQSFVPFSKMVYKRPDMDAFQKQLQDIRKRLDANRSVVYVANGINDFFVLYNDFYTNMNLANIYYCKDLTDTHWETEYNFCAENQTVVESTLDEMYRTLAASQYREDLETNRYFGEGFFDSYDSESFWDETYTALAEEEYRLQNRYYELSSQALAVTPQSEEFYRDYGSQMAEVLVELIAVRQKIAKYLGYNSYVDFAYENFYYRDYTPQQAEQYFRFIGEQLCSIYCDFNRSDVWTTGTQFCTEAQTFDYVKNAAARMGGRVGEAFTFLEKAKLYDIAYGENKYQVSFEVFLDSYGQPFVFTNPAMQNSDKLVFAHEFGHFANDYVCGGSYVGTDISEIHSGAMEYLSLCYTDDAEGLEKFKLADSLCTFVEQSAYALFEQQVYGLAGEDLTVENVQNLYADICTDFGFESWSWDSRDYVTIPHFFTNPMYVASYVVSNDLAFQIYQMEKGEAGAGLQVYQQCLESQDSYILDFAKTYGLESPFTFQRVQALRKTFEKALEK